MTDKSKKPGKKSSKKQIKPVAPLEDWYPALRNTEIEGAFFWVINEKNRVIDATKDVAAVAGMALEDYIGSLGEHFRPMTIEPSKEVRDARRARLFKDGGSDTHYVKIQFADGTGMLAVITTTRLDHPNGKKYLLQTGHDVSDIAVQLDYLKAPAFQGLLMLIIEAGGTCMAATEAAAKFILAPGGTVRDMVGTRLEETPYPELVKHEAQQLALSKATNAPAISVDWLVAREDGSYKPYTVARVYFPSGRWLIMMLPTPTEVPPFMQLDLKDEQDLQVALHAPNLQSGPGGDVTLTPGQFQTLLDIMQDRPVKDLMVEYKVGRDAINARRASLAEALGLPSVKEIKAAMLNTEMGYLAQLYTKIIKP